MPNAQKPLRPTMSSKDAARLGREIYKRDILPLVKDDHFGEYVAIDVPTGRWAIADTEKGSVKRLRESHPDAIDVLCERVGHRAVRSFGGSTLGEIE